MTPTEESLFRGSARAALTTGVPVSIRYGADALHDLDVVLDEQLPADRVLVGGLDRKDAVAPASPSRSRAAAPSSGSTMSAWTTTTTTSATASARPGRSSSSRPATRDRILLSSNAIGVAKGHPDSRRAVQPRAVRPSCPCSRRSGLTDEDVQRILVDNPRDLLSVR